MATPTLLCSDAARTVIRTLWSRKAVPLTAYGFCDRRTFQVHRNGFNGEVVEPTSGHYLLGNGRRSYLPVLSRFNSPDTHSPFGAGGVNAYAYCEADPVNWRDPSGQFRVRWALRLRDFGWRNPGMYWRLVRPHLRLYSVNVAPVPEATVAGTPSLSPAPEKPVRLAGAPQSRRPTREPSPLPGWVAQASETLPNASASDSIEEWENLLTLAQRVLVLRQGEAAVKPGHAPAWSRPLDGQAISQSAAWPTSPRSPH